MRRLTKRYNNGIVTLDADAFMEKQETIDREIQNCYPAKKAVERLAEYEDAEESGLMLLLPCKVGDKVYEIVTIFDDATLTEKRIIKTRVIDYITTAHLYECKGRIFNDDDFGKTVFLTREEAEKALEEKGGL